MRDGSGDDAVSTDNNAFSTGYLDIILFFIFLGFKIIIINISNVYIKSKKCQFLSMF